MRRYIFAAMLALFALLPLSREEALGAGHGFEFEDARERYGWMAVRGDISLEGGSLKLRSANFPALYSPQGLGFPTDATVLRVRLKSTKEGMAVLTFFMSKTARSHKKSFKVSAGDDFRVYTVYLGDIFPPDEFIHAVAFSFQGAPLDLDIDYIRLSEPTRAGLAKVFWGGFWEADQIRVGMSNFVKSPKFGPVPFMLILYALSALVFVAVLVYFAVSGRGQAGRRAVMAVVFAFAAASFAFTVRMDYGWLRVWQEDASTLGGKEVSERLSHLYGGDLDTFFGFIEGMKESVPEGETIRPAARQIAKYEDHAARLVRYYALPLESSPNASYLWVYYDMEDIDVTYDPAGRTLKKGEKVVAVPVELVKTFGSEAALFKKVSERDGGGGGR